MMRVRMVGMMLVLVCVSATSAHSQRQYDGGGSDGDSPPEAYRYTGGLYTMPIGGEFSDSYLIDRAWQLYPTQPAIDLYLQRGYMRHPEGDRVIRDDSTTCVFLSYQKFGSTVMQAHPVIRVVTKVMPDPNYETSKPATQVFTATFIDSAGYLTIARTGIDESMVYAIPPTDPTIAAQMSAAAGGPDPWGGINPNAVFNSYQDYYAATTPGKVMGAFYNAGCRFARAAGLFVTGGATFIASWGAAPQTPGLLGGVVRAGAAAGAGFAAAQAVNAALPNCP